MAFAWLLCSSAKYAYLGYRNYGGYCAATGARVPDQKKTDAAIAYLLRWYPRDETGLRRFVEEPFSGIVTLNDGPYTPIGYDDVADFKRHNVNCCRVLWQVEEVESPPASSFDRIMGVVSSFVEIAYVVRYRDASGRYVEKKRMASYPVTNCGVVWHQG